MFLVVVIIKRLQIYIRIRCELRIAAQKSGKLFRFLLRESSSLVYGVQRVEVGELSWLLLLEVVNATTRGIKSVIIAYISEYLY